ncbi:homeobox-leucine zipper protein HOX29 [Brachypodium distachyon]|uniref:homeobox-leucine zipper protein HOX29 n=1 Tax=Brachypodium distachyon TaxID=15368 RepID=UPI000234E0AF|nr:homeobox-leucine zipper protein HOX29 [Brachypodium distachyon]XP_024314171.1 homeobox-leucine zipper protein HOX29 [Brachypodium distachyon]|eukprot:XP_003565084.1 homeobox-leucine zipper protein HOX29 [Brachypodium distachyon]
MVTAREMAAAMDASKYVRYTPEQVEALERLYYECPKPSSLRRQQLVRECAVLAAVDPKQIKVWFQNRRCREKQRRESGRLQSLNRKLTAMNKLLMEENDRLQKQVSSLVYENGYYRQQHTHSAGLATTDTSCESVVTSGQQQNVVVPPPPRDASPAGLMSIAEETLTEFLSKATGTAVEWVQMPGMKPGPDSIGIIAISHGCAGVAARACGLVGMEPAKVAEILKDRPLWLRDCRSMEVVNVLPAGSNGTIELLYMQLYAQTTLAPARDFWLLRYTSILDDGSLVVCERSLSSKQGGPSMPLVQPFIRGEMLPSGFLIRPSDGGGSVIHIVDHLDLEPRSVPEVVRPLYESSAIVAQKMSMAALRYLRQLAHEDTHSIITGWGRQPAALRALSQKLTRGFNEALCGLTDDGWSAIESDGVDDVCISVNSSLNKVISCNATFGDGLPIVSAGVLCAKASMLLQDVSPPSLLQFLHEHRSQWADSTLDAFFASALKPNFCNLPMSRLGGFSGQVILPLAHTFDPEEFLEVIKIGNASNYQDTLMHRDLFLLQMYNGVDENTVGSCSELIFAPIDASFSDDSPLLPSGFRIIPIDSPLDTSSPNCTLDLASTLEVGTPRGRMTGSGSVNGAGMKAVMTIAFQFAFESHLQDSVAAMAQQYMRSIISSVQRIALALSSSRLVSHGSPRLLPHVTPEAATLSRWIVQSYRFHFGAELIKSGDADGGESVLKSLWHHTSAILCCSLKAMPVLTFANQSGLDMLETTLAALQDMALEKILGDQAGKSLLAELPGIMEQGFACVQGGVCASRLGRPAAYEKAVAWKVLDDGGAAHCVCFAFLGWSFV